MRITLSEDEVKQILEDLKKHDDQKTKDLYNLINDQYQKHKKRDKSKKVKAIQEVNMLRKKRTKEKILSALNKLKNKNEKITIKKVSELSGCSYLTARKYLQQEDLT